MSCRSPCFLERMARPSVVKLQNRFISTSACATSQGISSWTWSPEEINEEQKDEFQELQKPRRPLPLSPLMDPNHVAARRKGRTPKASPRKMRTLLQKKLDKNPYAQALATPVRKCAVTSSHLPEWFLQDFTLIGHPETGEPWMLPESLSKRFYVPKGQKQKEPASTVEKLLETRRFGPRTYVLHRHALIESFGRVKSFSLPENMWWQHRSMQYKDGAGLKDQIKWRPDTHSHILELHRRHLMQALEYLASSEADYLVSCPGGYDEAKGLVEGGSVMWLGPEEHISGVSQPDASGKGSGNTQELECGSSIETSQNDPAAFATLDIDREISSKIPVHNMKLLLGLKYLQQLREKFPSKFGTEIIVIKNKRMTTGLQLRLWKIQGYLYDAGVPPIKSVEVRKDKKQRTLPHAI